MLAFAWEESEKISSDIWVLFERFVDQFFRAARIRFALIGGEGALGPEGKEDAFQARIYRKLWPSLLALFECDQSSLDGFLCRADVILRQEPVCLP